MINTSKSDCIILIDQENIGSMVYQATLKVYAIFNQSLSISPKIAAKPATSATLACRMLNEDILSTTIAWKEPDLRKLFQYLDSGINNGKDNMPVNPTTSVSIERKNSVLKSFFRFVVIQLWADKVLIAPPSFKMPINLDGILDNLCIEIDNKFLLKIRGVNNVSSLASPFFDELKDRNRRATMWIRMLLATDFYDEKSFFLSNLIEFLSATKGAESGYSGRYPNEFILALSGNSRQLQITANEAINEIRQKNQKIPPVKKRKKKNKVDTIRKISFNERTEGILKYISDTADTNDSVLKIYENLPANHLNKLLAHDHIIFKTANKTVSDFIIYFSSVYEAWIESQNLQKNSPHKNTLAIIKVYLLIYLPRFFLARDGNLIDYPTSFNDFNCAYYVSMTEKLKKLASKQKASPKTLITFINGLAEYRNWKNDTQYVSIKHIDNFCSYIEDNAALIPDANNFRNTVSSANYPKLTRRITTAKTPIPRRYFSALISLLYTLDALVEHINSMAYEDTPGLIDGELINVTLNELENLHTWSDLWGRRGNFSKADDLPLEKLNYTPIFWFEGKLYPLKNCKRFYIVTEYVKDGITATIIAPHYTRILILMCETGIRQKHIKWLDLDRFDDLVEYQSKTDLMPLTVNTDKSHGEWIAIVSNRVIDICRKQREWYNRLDIDGFNNPLWYGNVKGSAFGQFKPLFRINDKSTSNSIEHSWPHICWTLQNFIRNVVNDYDTPDLVRRVKPNESYEYDGIDIDEFESDKFNNNGFTLRTRTTPHGLRATFVSDKRRYLPASIIGEFLTGQTDALVHYYDCYETEDPKTHGELLIDRFMSAVNDSEKGIPPQVAKMAARINKAILGDVELNPEKAITKHGLISLSGTTNDKIGTELLRLKKYTRLAFNDTHICPFDNKCPTEIIRDYGDNCPCSICPYAIRGPYHLDAISAAKDRANELARQIKKEIHHYQSIPKGQRNEAELEKLYKDYDYEANDAFCLEFTEHQLYTLHSNGNLNSYIAGDNDGLRDHFRQINVPETDQLLKRLVDIQNFPQLGSPEVQALASYSRKKLLLAQGDIDSIINPIIRSESAELIAVIKSMMDTKKLSIGEIFAMAKSELPNFPKKIQQVATAGIEFSKEPKLDV